MPGLVITDYDITYVNIWAKTQHVYIQTEIHFIALAYSYTI